MYSWSAVTCCVCVLTVACSVSKNFYLEICQVKKSKVRQSFPPLDPALVFKHQLSPERVREREALPGLSQDI